MARTLVMMLTEGENGKLETLVKAELTATQIKKIKKCYENVGMPVNVIYGEAFAKSIGKAA